MATETINATMSFSFVGSEVSIFGARRRNHGQYEVQVDSGSSFQSSGVPLDESEDMDQPLFQRKLKTGLHTITLRNLENDKFLDVDYVSLKAEVGEGSSYELTTIQDTKTNGEVRFSYTPQSAWQTVTRLPSTRFFGESGHITNKTESVATLFFEGHAVALYGPSGPNFAAGYTVSLNRDTPQRFSAKRRFVRSQQLLYFASGLDGGSQEISIAFSGAPGEFLAIDFANVYRGTNESSPSSRNGPSPGIVFGLTFSSSIAFLLVMTFVVLLLRRQFGFFSFFSGPKLFSDTKTVPPSESLPSNMSFTEISTQYASTSYGPSSVAPSTSNHRTMRSQSPWSRSSLSSRTRKARQRQSNILSNTPSSPPLPSIQDVDFNNRSSFSSDVEGKTVDIHGYYSKENDVRPQRIPKIPAAARIRGYT